jgi:uncharacterized protein (DUF1697 family)
MTRHIGLLRAINVGGNNLIPMADLRELLEEVGFAGARTILQSGNVVFEAGKRKADALEALLETHTKRRFGADVDWIVRTADEWDAMIDANPLPEEAAQDPSHCLVHCLKRTPTATQVKALVSAIPGREIVRAKGRHLYIVYPDGIGKSKLNMTLIERKLGCSGTARNWNTVLKLQALARAR